MPQASDSVGHFRWSGTPVQNRSAAASHLGVDRAVPVDPAPGAVCRNPCDAKGTPM